MMKIIPLLMIATVCTLSSIAQGRVPAAVTDSFSRKFPGAEKVEYRDVLVGYSIHFFVDSTRMVARFTNRGEWKETDRQINYDRLPPEVKDGFQKSKYALPEWKVTETMIVTEPGKPQTFRIRVEKNELQKKYLYFSPLGQLVRDNITL